MLLTAVDAGLGACFAGIPRDGVEAYRAEFGVPSRLSPIGVISVGYSAEPRDPDRPRRFAQRRRARDEVVHRGDWGAGFEPGSRA